MVCGWSATWDIALRNALLRAPPRRFATYWAMHGQPTDDARRLIEHRGAQVLPIADADSFFQSLEHHVQSLEQFARPHPLSTAIAVASLEHYLSESRYRIQLAHLIGDTVGHIIEVTSAPAFSAHGGAVPTPESFTAQVRAYEAACSTLIAMAPIGGYWAEEDHVHAWQSALQRLSVVTGTGGNECWRELQRYPATLLLYGLGIGAVRAGRLGFVGRLFGTPIYRENREDLAAVQLLPPWRLFQLEGRITCLLEGMESRGAPLNDWLHAALRESVRPLIPSDDQYTLLFDKLEILIGLGFARHDRQAMGRYGIPPGAFVYRRSNRERVLAEIKESIARLNDKSPFVGSDILGDTADNCTKNLSAFRDFVEKLVRW